MITEAVIIFVSLIVGFILGYVSGYKKDVREFIDETGQKIQIEAKKLVVPPPPSIPTGRIRTMSEQEKNRRHLDPIRREGLEEVKNTLDGIPELVAAKELATQMRKEQYG